MPRPYSQDLCEGALALVEAGQTRRQVARLLNRGESPVINWAKRHKVTGKCAAKPMGGKRRRLMLSERDWLLARVAVAPDLTVRALRGGVASRVMV